VQNEPKRGAVVKSPWVRAPLKQKKNNETNVKKVLWCGKGFRLRGNERGVKLILGSTAVWETSRKKKEVPRPRGPKKPLNHCPLENRKHFKRQRKGGLVTGSGFSINSLGVATQQRWGGEG